MEKQIKEILAVLQKQVGLHRQLLDVVRAEKNALTEMNLKAVQDATYAKEAVVEQIRHAEAYRSRAVTELAMIWGRSPKELIISQLILLVQNSDQKLSDEIRATFNTLNILVERISEQNAYNKALTEKALEHINQMKSNVLKQTSPKNNTYTAQGKAQQSTGGARLISKEA